MTLDTTAAVNDCLGWVSSTAKVAEWSLFALCAPVIVSLCGCFLSLSCCTTQHATREMEVSESSRALLSSCLLSGDCRMT